MPRFPAPPAEPWRSLGLGMLALLLQAMLLLTPGYFSHDELQWAMYADPRCPQHAPAPGWGDVDVFQYRPLTFGLWHALSPVLFAHPWVFHALWVLLGTANAFLLRALLRRLDIAPAPADGAAVLFLLHPYAAYVHGWIGTLGDLLWVGAGLAGALAIQRLPAHRLAAPTMLAACAAAFGLVAKEAAVALAPMAAVALLMARGERRWLGAALGAGVVTALYLVLRVDALLAAPRTDGAYTMSLLAPPARALEYLLYPFLPTRPEAQFLLQLPGSRLLFAAAGAGLMLFGLARASWRWMLGAAALALASLGPVLILEVASTQYGYGLAAVTAAACGFAWRRTTRAGRWALGVAATVMVWHGLQVQHFIRRAGVIESQLSPALVAHERRGGGEIRIAAVEPRDASIVQRLIHEVACRDGVPMRSRVTVAAPGQAADWTIGTDARLQRH